MESLFKYNLCSNSEKEELLVLAKELTDALRIEKIEEVGPSGGDDGYGEDEEGEDEEDNKEDEDEEAENEE